MRGCEERSFPAFSSSPPAPPHYSTRSFFFFPLVVFFTVILAIFPLPPHLKLPALPYIPISIYSPASLVPAPSSQSLPVWAGPCQGLCLSPSFDMPLIMVRWGNTTLCVSLSIFSLLYSSAHPLPCQNVMLLQNGENQLNVSSLKTVCSV